MPIDLFLIQNKHSELDLSFRFYINKNKKQITQNLLNLASNGSFIAVQSLACGELYSGEPVNESVSIKNHQSFALKNRALLEKRDLETFLSCGVSWKIGVPFRIEGIPLADIRGWIQLPAMFKAID